MSGFDQSSIAVPMPAVVESAAALGGPFKIKPSEAFSSALVTISGLTGETISFETSPDGYWGAPASPTFYRTDWQGTLLLYPTARTNLVLNSGDATLWAHSETADTLQSATSPSGAAVPYVITESANNAPHSLSQTITATAGSMSYSVYAKAQTRKRFLIRENSVTGAAASFDLSTGTVVANAGAGVGSITDMGGGWFRCSLLCTPTAGARILAIYLLQDSGTAFANVTYAGTVGAGIWFWGMQAESGTATSYIPTVASPVTITDYTLSNGLIALAAPPAAGATLSYDNSVLPSPYYIFATGDGTRTAFAYDGVWGTLAANAGKGNGIFNIDLRGAQAFKLTKSAGSETATVNMTLKRDALQYTNSAGTWSVT